MAKVGTEEYCVVDGAPVYSPGNRYEFLSGRVDELLRICDGVKTCVGVVCASFLRFYDVVSDLVRNEMPGASTEEIISVIRDRLLMRTRRESSRNEVLSIIKGWGERLSGDQIMELKDFFLRGIHISDYDDGDLSGNNMLPLKIVLGCLMDDERINVFLNALLVSLGRLEKVKDEIEVIDVSCGPIPFPLFGIMAALRSPKVKKVTCLEVDPNYARMAEKIISNLGLSDIVEVVNCDATEYQHDGGEVDLLISEPLVRVLNNLASHVAEDGEIIPSEVFINAGLIRADYAGPELTEFAVYPANVFNYVAGDGCERIEFSLAVDGLQPGEYQLVLSADVELCDGVGLPKTIRTEAERPYRAGMPFYVSGWGDNAFVSYKPEEGCGYVKVEVR